MGECAHAKTKTSNKYDIQTGGRENASTNKSFKHIIPNKKNHNLLKVEEEEENENSNGSDYGSDFFYLFIYLFFYIANCNDMTFFQVSFSS